MPNRPKAAELYAAATDDLIAAVMADIRRQLQTSREMYPMGWLSARELQQGSGIMTPTFSVLVFDADTNERLA